MLPASWPWEDDPALGRVAAALAARGQARVVGGAVRDALLRLPVHDIDLATPLAPAEVLAALEQAGVKAVPTGLAHGTITAVAGGRPFEITTLRRDLATDGRHAIVAATDRWEEDAARRDFTINALYAQLGAAGGGARHVLDWHGGLDDLAAGRVRFIGQPAQRIAEDYLRILRFYRFSARFAQLLDEPGHAACMAAAEGLARLSRERVRDELLRLLVLPRAPDMVAAMARGGLLHHVVPGARVEALAAVARAEAEAGLPPQPIRRLAALVPPDQAATLPADLRLSRAEAGRLSAALASQPGGAAMVGAEAMAWQWGRATAQDRLLLAGDAAGARALEGWEPPRFPLKGGDLVALGVPRGPEVSSLLRLLEQAWALEGFRPTRDELLTRAARARAAGVRRP